MLANVGVFVWWLTLTLGRIVLGLRGLLASWSFCFVGGEVRGAKRLASRMLSGDQ